MLQILVTISEAGQFQIKSNVPDKVRALGMLELAKIELAKAKGPDPNEIQVPDAKGQKILLAPGG